MRKECIYYWIPSHVGIRGNKKTGAAAKAGPLGSVTNVPFPYGDLKKTSMVFQNANSIMSGTKQSTTNYMNDNMGTLS